MLAKAELLRKYNVPGPRYTSYPTVPYWDRSPTGAEWINSISLALQEGLEQKIGAALYIHIPFCRNLCTYCGCNTRITRNEHSGEPYVTLLHQELALYQKALAQADPPWRDPIPVSEMHLGGGTPTFLSPELLRHLIQGLSPILAIQEGAECSIEADPRVTTLHHLETLASLGFKRLSLGIQDFEPAVQELVNRVQSEEEVRRLTEQARALGFESINYDLIYGLPGQIPAGIERTLEAVIRLNPDRIAYYSYAHVPWIRPGQRRFTDQDVPVGETKRALYERGRELLEAVGYFEIGLDHFARAHDSLYRASRDGSLHRNFMGYTTKQVSPLIGLGVSSIGDSWRIFAQNEKLLETYRDRVQRGEIPLQRGHVLDAEDLVIRRHILNLMTRLATSWEITGHPQSSTLYTPFLEQIAARLSAVQEDGLVRLEHNHCQIEEVGRPFLRNICMAFDARLERRAPGTALFSQTI